MQETFISFYLKDNRIRIFVEALRGLGKPSRICFMVGENGTSLLIAPHDKRDFLSHAVPPEAYTGKYDMRVSSYRLCRIIAQLHNWDLSRSYRVPGKVYPEQKVAIFDLNKAEVIDHTEMGIAE